MVFHQTAGNDILTDVKLSRGLGGFVVRLWTANMEHEKLLLACHPKESKTRQCDPLCF